VTCGDGSLKRVRYLQATHTAPSYISASDVQQVLEEDADAETEAQRRWEVVLSFACGALLASAVFAVVMTVVRAQRNNSNQVSSHLG